MQQLVYLADIFSHLNDLNIIFQVRDKKFFSWEKNAVFKILLIWVTLFEKKKNFDSFPHTFQFIEKNIDITDVILKKYFRV
jgi:hypothetical protein